MSGNSARLRALAVLVAFGVVYVASRASYGPAHAEIGSVASPFPGFTVKANAEGKPEVTSVTQGSTAADLQPRDVITAVDGTELTPDQLSALLKTLPVGTSVVLDYVRPPLNIPQSRLLLNAPPLPPQPARPGWIVGRVVTTSGAPLTNATVRLTGMVHRALGVTTPQGPQLTDDTYINIPVGSGGRYEKKLEDGWYATSGWATVSFEGKTANVPLTPIGSHNVRFLGGHRDSRNGIAQDFCLDTRTGNVIIQDVAPIRSTPVVVPGSRMVLTLTPQALAPGGSVTQGYRASWVTPTGTVLGTHTAKGIPLGRYTATVTVIEPSGAILTVPQMGAATTFSWAQSASVLFPLDGLPAPGTAMPIMVDPTRSH